MLKTEALVKQFDETESLVLAEAENVGSAFSLPVRNWNGIVESYNAGNNRAFYLSALQCKVIVEWVKKGIPPKYIFEALGITPQKQSHLVTQAINLDEKFEALASKDRLSTEEYDELNILLRHPLRILMEDVRRAEAISSLQDFEKFNEFAVNNPDVHLTKMKVRFKDMFSDKPSDTGPVNVQINVGFDVNDL